MTPSLHAMPRSAGQQLKMGHAMTHGESAPAPCCREIDHAIPWSDRLGPSDTVGVAVAELLPPGFDCYVRVFHPIVRWEAEPADMKVEPRIATWSELAALSSLTLKPTLVLGQLKTGFEALEPERGRMALWHGELEESTSELLYRTLDREGGGLYRFAFGLTTIISSDSHSPMAFETDSLSGRRSVIEAVRNAGSLRATTAECVWPVGEGWIVFTDYDLTSTYVACDNESADLLLGAAQLETVLVQRSTRVDNSAYEQPET
jgi:hypothetical protein